MATLGIKRAWVARVNKKTGEVITGVDGLYGDASDKSGVYEINADTAKGLSSLALSNLQGALTPLYYSDQIVYQSAGKGAAQGVLTVGALDNDVKQRILGNASDGKGGYTITGKANSSNTISLLVESREAFDDDAPVYVGLYQSVVTEASTTISTSNASEVRTTDVLTFGATERGNDGFGKFYFSSSKGFDQDAMMKDVFKPAVTTGDQG